MNKALLITLAMLLAACPDDNGQDALDAAADSKPPAADTTAADAALPDSSADIGPDQNLVDSRAPDIGAVTPSKWVTIKPGTYTMGSPKTETCREIGSLMETEHKVTLTRSFEISTTEVTQAQFLSLMWFNPSKHTGCLDCPVEMVNWYEAAAYCNALSAQKGLTQCYACKGTGKDVTCAEAAAFSAGKVYDCPGYRLPTDAEWEYAYRAGTTTSLYNGDLAKCSEKDPNADKIAWHGKICSESQPGGKKLPNAWGLYDMAGNVREWCHDWMINDLGAAAAADPWGHATEKYYRINRGGSWWGMPYNLRAAHRFNKPPTYRCHGIGIRCARTIK